MSQIESNRCLPEEEEVSLPETWTLAVEETRPVEKPLIQCAEEYTTQPAEETQIPTAQQIRKNAAKEMKPAKVDGADKGLQDN